MEPMIAFILAVLLTGWITLVKHRFRSWKARFQVTIGTGLLLFLVILFLALGDVDKWVPLQGSAIFASNVEPLAITTNIILVVALSLAGIILGAGLFPVLEKLKEKLRLLDVNLNKKRLAEFFTDLLGVYFVVVVLLSFLDALLDLFGILPAFPELRVILALSRVHPLVWQEGALLFGFLKFWFTGRLNLDFSFSRVKRYMNPRKFFFHKLLVALLLPAFSWGIFVLQFSILTHPAVFAFDTCLIVGFSSWCFRKSRNDD